MPNSSRMRTDANALLQTAREAVMTYGAFEQSGEARLIVLRRNGLFIAHSTPFNPLPNVVDGQKSGGARPLPYTLQVWQENRGKVFSAGWNAGETAAVAICRNGPWRSALRDIVRDQPREKTKRRLPRAGSGRDRKDERITATKFRALEKENERLRQTISTILFEKVSPFDKFGRR